MKAGQILSRLSAVAAETSNSAGSDSQEGSTSSTGPETLKRQAFQLDITDELPTGDQLQTIMEYSQKANIGSIVQGATTINEAFKKYKENPDNFRRPVVSLHRRLACVEPGLLLTMLACCLADCGLEPRSCLGQRQ